MSASVFKQRGFDKNSNVKLFFPISDEESVKSGSGSTSSEDPNPASKRGLFKWGSVNRPKKFPENENEHLKGLSF